MKSMKIQPAGHPSFAFIHGNVSDSSESGIEEMIARAISGICCSTMNVFTFRSKAFMSSLLSRCCSSKVNPPVAPSPGIAGGV